MAVPALPYTPAGGSAAARQPNGTLLVTGAGGFLGSAVVRHAGDLPYQVSAVLRPVGDPSRLASSTTTVVEADLTDAAQVEALLARTDPAVVVHAAAAPGHPRTPAERAAAWQVNLLATVHLLAALDRHPEAVLVHVGAATEYAPSDEPLAESQACAPITVRGASKLAATVAVRQWAAESGRPAVVVRPFSIYGPREAADRLIPTLLRCARSGEPFTMLDGVSRRDLVHVDDVAEGCLRAAAVASPAAPVVNLGTGVEHTVEEVRQAVEAATGRPVHLRPERRPLQAHDVAHWVADTRRCAELLGWTPRTTLHDGLAALVSAGAA